jgi:hypothetical protein
MRTNVSFTFRCLVTGFVLALAIGALPQAALAQSGVDNSTSTGVFQTEGDAQRTGTICWLSFANGGPAIATPGSTGGGNPNKLDINGCPTVNPAGGAATWSLISYGSNTDDWSSFAFSGGVFTSKAHALFTPAFVTDATNSQTDNTFLGASSKDTQDISAWNWNPHGTQDKDDIAHSFAGAYRLANNHTALYAGMDRFANAGDSTAGFWFVQDSNFALCTGFHLAAGLSGNVTNNSCTAAGTFVGHHFDGDLLVVSDFSVGGAVSTINVFVWQGGNLVLDATRSPAPCDPATGNSTLCGLVNNAFTQVLNRKGSPVLNATTVATGGWTFGDKGGFAAYQTGEFLEIAIDLNDPTLFPNGAPCFSTFFSETRSSTSVGAALSDLTIPVSFPLCSLNVSKTCTTAEIVNGNQVKYNFSGSVSNTGSSTLYAPVVYDTPPASIVGTVTLNQPAGPINAGSSATYTGSFVSSTLLTNEKNRVSAAASSNQSGTPLNVICGDNPPTATGQCADWGSPCSPTITSGLTITKACKSCLVASGGDVHVTVSEAFKVCNSGNTNVTGLTVRDCRGTISGAPGSQTCSTGFVSILSNGSLGPGTPQNPTCTAQLSSSYTPTGLPDANGNYADQVIAQGTAAFVGTVFANNGVPVQASCPVCPIQTDCSTNPPVAP